MSVDGTLGSLLQGVSQQPQAVRPDGKVTEQINLTSDVVQGLTSRPALFENGIFFNVDDADYRWLDFAIGNDKYIMSYRNNEIRLFDLQGMEQTITTQGGATSNYIGNDMRAYVFEDVVYLTNRNQPVRKKSSPNTSSRVPGFAGITYCLGGVYSRTYTLRVRYADGVSFEAAYTTPDGQNAGDADKTSSVFIMQQLNTAVLNNASLKSSTNVFLNGDTLLIRDSSISFSLSVTDGEDGTSLRAFTDRVNSLEDLSETSITGHIVRVINSDEGQEDDFFMRFNSDVTNNPGGGFGDGGVWQEWFNVDQVSELDLATMPHVLRKTGPGQFTLSWGEWETRRVGDDDTNPFPDFVDYSVRDLGGFQSRLVFLAGPSVCMSRTNEPADFFKKSVITDLATDPINITSTQEGTTSLDWIIAFDRDLVLMTDPGDGQFIISGSSSITPFNASLVKTTSFEMRGGAKPIETGRTILFPFKSGNFSGSKEFFTNDEVATNGADTITETVDRYLPGLIDHMSCSTNFSMAVFKTDEQEMQDTVWVYKYLWQNVEKIQSAWSKWVFPHKVEHFFFDGSELHVVMSRPANTGKVDLVFNALDLDIPRNEVAGYHICLDRQVNRIADSFSNVALNVDGALFVQGLGCADPGRQVFPLASWSNPNGTYTYNFQVDTVPEGATVFAGLPYERVLKPTMPFVRSRQGAVLPRTHLVVGSFLLEYEDTGHIKSTMTSRYRQQPIEFVMDWFPLDNDPIDPLSRGLRSGILNIPWGERSDWSELTLSSSDVRPTTILEIEWVGQVFKGSRG